MKNIIATIACIGMLLLFALGLALAGFHGPGGIIAQLFLWLVLMPATFYGVKSYFPDKKDSQTTATEKKVEKPIPFAGFQDISKQPSQDSSDRKMLSDKRD